MILDLNKLFDDKYNFFELLEISNKDSVFEILYFFNT